MPKYKILLADDHEMIREGFKMILKRNKMYEVVGEALNGQEAIALYKSARPDVVIMDISMPVLNGMEAAKEIIATDPNANIIILSMYDDEDYISQCTEYGIKGYVVKNESSNELESAIQAVIEGQTYFSSRVREVIVRKYTSAKSSKSKKEINFKLTARETEIVRLIAEGLTSQSIAEKLFISPRTVETHRANLMKKADVNNSIELVKKMEKFKLI